MPTRVGEFDVASILREVKVVCPEGPVRFCGFDHRLSVECFRKSQEEMVLGQIAEQVCWIAGTGNRNAEMYKASVSASLRRAGAVRDAAGDVIADPVREDLAAWRRKHGVLHRPALPGAVAPAGPGVLAARGVRRIYHAAVAVPRPGTQPLRGHAAGRRRRSLPRTRPDVAGARRPHTAAAVHLLPLLGAGRGGLPPETSVSALWTALAADAEPDRELHPIVRRPLVADLVADVLGSGRSAPAGLREEKGHG